MQQHSDLKQADLISISERKGWKRKPLWAPPAQKSRQDDLEHCPSENSDCLRSPAGAGLGLVIGVTVGSILGFRNTCHCFRPLHGMPRLVALCLVEVLCLLSILAYKLHGTLAALWPPLVCGPFGSIFGSIRGTKGVYSRPISADGLLRIIDSWNLGAAMTIMALLLHWRPNQYSKQTWRSMASRLGRNHITDSVPSIRISSSVCARCWRRYSGL